jgi:hypothetical protein
MEQAGVGSAPLDAGSGHKDDSEETGVTAAWREGLGPGREHVSHATIRRVLLVAAREASGWRHAGRILDKTRVSQMGIPNRRKSMRFAFVLIAVFALAAVAFAADIAGTWKGTMETPMGPMENTIVLQADGASLTGSVKTDMFEAKVENGKLDGDKVSFEINIEFGKLVYEGTLAEDDLKLNVTAPDGGKIPLNAKRQK